LCLGLSWGALPALPGASWLDEPLGGPTAIQRVEPGAQPVEGFTVPVVENTAVRAWVDRFCGRGKYLFAGWLARRGRYAPPLEAALTRAGLPRELVDVALIESGLDPFVVSPAGAVGPWQLMADTAQQLGLRRDEWIDERRDWARSTEAAGRYLGDLHGRFGSWPLALAAYNAGPATVTAAVRISNSNDFWVLAASGALPSGTTQYVPKALATMLLARDPARCGFTQVQVDAAEPIEEVEVPGGTPLDALARRSGIDLATLVTLNPALRRGRTPPGRAGWRLRVPSEGLARVHQALAAEPAGGRVLEEHRVRFGERVADLASLYGASEAELRRLNELGGREPAPDTTVFVPADGRAVPTTPTEPLLVQTRPALRLDALGRREVHFPVRSRMDIAEIAAFFEVSPGDIGLWNGLDPSVPVQRGMVLRLYVDPDFDTRRAALVDPVELTVVAPDTEGATRALAGAEAPRDPRTRRVDHVVAQGDTLWKIARRYGISLDALRAENGLGARDRPAVGRRLKVPTVVARREATPSSRGGARYRVAPGDTLARIARAHRTSPEKLKRKNGLVDDRLRPGQVLLLP
jgi:membrane-bound lytic murein transglycosylase D